MFPKSESEVYITFSLEEDIKRIATFDSSTEIVEGSFKYLIDLFKQSFGDVLILNPNDEMTPIYDAVEVMSKK